MALENVPEVADQVPVVVPPLIDPARVADVPAQMDWSAPALVVTGVFTVTVIDEVAVHPDVVPVTVYVVVVVGVAVTDEPVEALRLPVGDHVYESAPLAVNVVELPEQIGLADAERVTVGAAHGHTAVTVAPAHSAPA